MATARTATVAANDHLGQCAHLLTLRMADSSPLGFVGGQYLIVNTGLPVPGSCDGKVIKRCYSMVSADRDQGWFQLAMRPVGRGVGSHHMIRLAAGTELHFSGPWGKLLPEAEAAAGTALICATDTGITAALGLVNAQRTGRAVLLWYTESEVYFLPQDFVRGRLPPQVSYRFANGLAIGHPERARHAVATLKGALPLAPDIGGVALIGDGDILYPLQDALVESGIPAERIGIECFFHRPRRGQE